MLDNGADPNAPNEDGVSTLTRAVLLGSTEIVERLLANGANTNYQAPTKVRNMNECFISAAHACFLQTGTFLINLSYFADLFLFYISMKTLTLSLPHFWQNCSLSATFILTIRDILPCVAQHLPKILFFSAFIFYSLSKISKIWIIEIQKYFCHYRISKERDFKQVYGKSAQVADRRRWQCAMTSPIGDVGSERVNHPFLTPMADCEVKHIWHCLMTTHLQLGFSIASFKNISFFHSKWLALHHCKDPGKYDTAIIWIQMNRWQTRIHVYTCQNV